jgi:RNA polymerase sigma-70 factor (ECF subfamily)
MFLKVKRHRKENPQENELPDETLVKQYLVSGNKDLIAILFERYTHLVYGICLHYLHNEDQCKDAVMEIFSSLFEKLSTHHIVSFKNWLYSVARNYCLMTLRKGASYTRSKENISTLAVTDSFELPSAFFDKGKLDDGLIYQAIDRLNTEQRLCVSLMYLEDKSYKDIVELTGYSINQVKSHIQNGKRNLKNYLLDKYDFIDP